MRRLNYTDDAKANLVEIARYIANTSGSRDVASKFTARLREQCSRLAILAGTLGRARPEIRNDVRSFPYQNYIIFFRYRDDVVEIINILHSAKDIEGYFGAN